MYPKYIKRILDCLICAIFVLLFWWLFLLIAIAIKIDDPSGPVLFNQERIGRYGKVFSMHKFRTMCVGAEGMGSGVYSGSGDSRVTRVGRVLRATSLDELPQLFNVLKGEMALIGFRPPLTYHPWPWEQYTDEQKRMFDQRPGLTGYAQIHGRRTVEWNDRIDMNVWYAGHVSFALDFRIFFSTFSKVFKNSDNSNNGVTVSNEDNFHEH